MDIECHTIETPTHGLMEGTDCYICGRDQALLVDPAAHTDRLHSELDRIAHIAVTHHHPDHVGAVASIAHETQATVWCRYGREADFEAATGMQPDRTFRDGSLLPVDDAEVIVHDTPGHAHEHVAFEVNDALLVGDLAVATGSVVVAPPDGDMRAYLTSLRRVYAMQPARLYPGHGPPIEDVRNTCQRLISHRLDRERRVLSAVEAGHDSLEAIVTAAYDKDLSGVRELAAGTVHAHLLKLAHEGRITWDGTTARSQPP